MKFHSIVVCLFAAASQTELASAFSPRNFIPNKTGLMVPSSDSTSSSTQQSPLWRPPMHMVAGGAERSYSQEYYEGA
jgi:hypothetical protein